MHKYTVPGALICLKFPGPLGAQKRLCIGITSSYTLFFSLQTLETISFGSGNIEALAISATEQSLP